MVISKINTFLDIWEGIFVIDGETQRIGEGTVTSKRKLFKETELEKIVLCYVFEELYLHDQFILLYVIQKLHNLLPNTLTGTLCLL